MCRHDQDVLPVDTTRIETQSPPTRALRIHFSSRRNAMTSACSQLKPRTGRTVSVYAIALIDWWDTTGAKTR
jgi:hypothetical protein